MEALILMRAYANQRRQCDIKTFAEATLPRVQMHLDMITISIANIAPPTPRRAQREQHDSLRKTGQRD